MVECTVFAVNEENYIVSEIKTEWHLAVSRYMGARDSKGNRYVIIPAGKPVPFKKRVKELKDISLRKELDQDTLPNQP